MIIQRWQSVFLLIAAVMMGLFAFLSLGQVQTTDFTLNFTSCGFTYEGEATDGAPTGQYLGTLWYFVLCCLSALLPFIAIFCFKNLRLQLQLCVVEVLFLLVVIGVGCWLGYTAVPGYAVGWSSVVCAPFVALVAMIVARRLIRKDRNTLRDADRIR